MATINLNRLEYESDLEYVYRICSNKEQIGTWDDVGAIINQVLHQDKSANAWRKKYAYMCRKEIKPTITTLPYKPVSIVETESTDSTEFSNEQRELRKERIKLQTEKIEYNKWLRENARDEMILEKIVSAISELPNAKLPKPIEPVHSHKSWLLCLADAHYGVEFNIKDFYGNTLNEYNPEIFEERMNVLLGCVVDKIKSENITELHVMELGDGIDGMLRLTSQLMKLRYGIIESSIRYAYFLASWLNELSRYTRIKFHMVIDSNHNQLRLLGAPKNAFPDENMSKVMIVLIKEILKDNPNIDIIENPTGMNYAMLSTYCVVGLHGENKNLQKNLLEMSHIYGIHIDYTVSAHKHHVESKEVGFDSATLSVGSIIGIDSYSMSLNAASNASASMFEFEQGRGRTAEYLFKLN